MALPLAPADMFEQGLQIIQEEADIISAEYPSVLQFTVYLRRTWLPLKDKVSVFGTSIRTNNFVESFHFAIFRKLGGIHPNIWNFLHMYCLLLLCALPYKYISTICMIFADNLTNLIADQEINIARLTEACSVRRPRSQYNTNRNKQIAKA